MPRNILAGALVALLVAIAAPRVRAEETLEQKRDQKLQSAFLKQAPWFTDYDKARAEAKSSGKPIFAYFTRSYSP
ncbi:MAG: hypothetical protein HZA54_02080 [Planctomycetes bacterium]|nr:hypothetical protein [Planctomycetota bacterium]